ncbi:hypothetical protein HanIR_Chr09g0445101 [Helianthus annuus]|nr:hypothetical protein HanIR_Chr09g0445101 [Helianthus annuus]
MLNRSLERDRKKYRFLIESVRMKLSQTSLYIAQVGFSRTSWEETGSLPRDA